MNIKNSSLIASGSVDDTQERFFREIEIEFLIHELKDPITVIETGLRMILGKKDKFGSLTERQEKTLKRALRNSEKARDMLNGLLEIGRSENGCFLCRRFQPGLSICQALADALETMTGVQVDVGDADRFASLAAEGIRVDIAPEVSEVEMMQDETKFRQIVGNLLKNALHHRRQRIDIRVYRRQEDLMIDIADDGPGVDPDYHEMIFRRYAQVKECTIAPRQGHGLGLAGARILARCLGGDIELESMKGGGALFRTRLPIKIAASGTI